MKWLRSELTSENHTTPLKRLVNPLLRVLCGWHIASVIRTGEDGVARFERYVLTRSDVV